MWKVGTAQAKITPEEPTWLAGYGGRDRPFGGHAARPVGQGPGPGGRRRRTGRGRDHRFAGFSEGPGRSHLGGAGQTLWPGTLADHAHQLAHPLRPGAAGIVERRLSHGEIPRTAGPDRSLFGRPGDEGGRHGGRGAQGDAAGYLWSGQGAPSLPSTAAIIRTQVEGNRKRGEACADRWSTACRSWLRGAGGRLRAVVFGTRATTQPSISTSGAAITRLRPA